MDLPTPGSPESKTTAPGTMPPPRTRSNSPTPVGLEWTLSVEISVIGLAAKSSPIRAGLMERTIPVPLPAPTAVS